jgi:hypothetical protein
MENKPVKLILVWLLAIHSLSAIGQSYPGFLGKKVAVGYTANICPNKVEFLFDGDEDMVKAVLDHNYYIEYATGKYSSLSVNFIHQTIPYKIYNSLDVDIHRSYTLGNQPYDVYFNLNSGRAQYRNVALGLKLNLYMPGKTISSPVGRSHYFKLAFMNTKMVEDDFEYYVSNRSELTAQQYARIVVPKGVGTSATNVSLGYGLESKRMLSNTLFFKSNIELNFSTAFLTRSFYEEVTFDEHYAILVNRATAMRNLFQFGFGLGMLVY